MRKLLFILALICAPLARGQATYPVGYVNGGNITATSANCIPTACVGIGLPTPESSIITVGVTGTFSATLAVEESQDGGTTFTSAGTAITSTGTTTYFIAGFTQFRVRASAYSSGNAGVNLQVSNAQTGNVTSGVGAPSGSCTANQIYINQSNGNIYSCSGGSWVLSGGGASGVTSVTGTSPVVSSGGTTPAISCPTCTTSAAAITNNVLAKGSGGGQGLANSTITDGGGGVQVGSPTGGAEGAGTINATGLFVNGGAAQVQTNVSTGCMVGCTYGVGNGEGFPLYGSTTIAMGTANQGQFVRFYNSSLRKLGNAVVRTATSSAGGHFSVGVYSISGTTATLIWTTGSQSTASATTNIAVTPTSVNLLAGSSYYIAWCADNTTATLLGPTNAGAANAFPSGTGGPANTWGIDATDLCATGVLPSTVTTTNIVNNAAASVPALLATN
jgi:hypothetical protein